MNEDAAEIRELSVGEFTQRLKDLFDRVKDFKTIALRGEISGWAPQGNGGVYFKLKDANALIDCYAFGSNAKRFETLADGMAAVATGSIEVRETKSGYQLLVREMHATGTGALHAKYQALREQFEREGLFAAERKRPLPAFIRSVALVSANRLGAEDFITKLQQQAPFVTVSFVETRVQGTGAEVDIAEALDRASRLAVDAIVLTRGGGSFEDLFPFNMEPVIRGIVRSRHPVITAVAHTRNRHLADLVSDHAAETPTAAALFIADAWQRGIERASALQMKLGYLIERTLSNATQRSDELSARVQRGWDRQFAAKRERLVSLQRRIDAQSPSRRQAEHATHFASAVGRMQAAIAAIMVRTEHRSKESSARLERAVGATLLERSRRVERAQAGLYAVDPLAPLDRGYAIVTANGAAVRDAAQLTLGGVASVRFGRGTAEVRVESTHDG